MRSLAVIPLALLLAGCWTPGPGQIDPTRYPWDQRMPKPSQPQPQPQPLPQPQPRVRAQGLVPPVAESDRPPHLQPLPQPQPQPDGSYCVMSLENGGAGGVSAGGRNGVTLGCTEPAPPQDPRR